MFLRRILVMLSCPAPARGHLQDGSYDLGVLSQASGWLVSSNSCIAQVPTGNSYADHLAVAGVLQCKERMLTILEDSDLAAASGGASTSPSETAASSLQSQHVYQDFRLGQ